MIARRLGSAAATLLLLVLCSTLPGCILAGNGLDFPAKPTSRGPSGLTFDVDNNGRTDFSIRPDASGRLDVLAYDDNQDGADDRVYRLSDYPPERVPHLIILLDSIPYQAVADRAREAGWSWFDPPQKVIPPFPTMSGVIFTRMLHAPPIGGMINQYFDRRKQARQDRIFARANGDQNAWERRLHYRVKYWENGLSFLHPRPCFQTELARVRQTLDDSPDRVTIVYLASTAGMLSKHGADGLNEVLDGLEQLCFCLLHDRQGALKLSVMADHGHNLIPGKRVDVADLLRAAGFSPGDRLRADDDVVVELDGLVNYAGIHTRHPAQVARALTAHPEIQLAMYLQGETVYVRDAGGRAAVERRAGRLRYTPMEHDVLGYAPIIEQFSQAGRLDADGFALDRDWFEATVDHQWPDAPHRLWDAFHGLAVNTPDVMITTAPGYFTGLASMERYITMASTHGGFDQIDSATFILTMTGRATRPMRTDEVIPTIEPSFQPDRKTD